MILLTIFKCFGYFPTNDMQTSPLPLSFDTVLMDDAECAEQNEKNNKKFSDFYFSCYREKFIENWGDDVTK